VLADAGSIPAVSTNISKSATLAGGFFVGPSPAKPNKHEPYSRYNAFRNRSLLFVSVPLCSVFVGVFLGVFLRFFCAGGIVNTPNPKMRGQTWAS